MQKFPMTLQGHNALQEELKKLKSVDRREVIQAIAEAREHGDLSENAEYHAARERQSFIEGRIAEIEGRLANPEIFDTAKLKSETIVFGATVTILDEDTDEKTTYQIVGSDEADIKAGRLSISAPLSRALIGKKVDESIMVQTPKGEKHYTVINIKFI